MFSKPVSRLILFVIIAVMLTGIGMYVVTGQTCPTRTKPILEMVNTVCQSGDRDYVCYGNVQVDAVPQPGVPHLDFDEPGDIEHISLIKSLQLSPMDLNRGTWGIARMRLALAAPRNPDDEVVLLLFGDVRVEDRSETRPSFDLTLPARQTLRSFPSLNSAALGVLETGSTATALGRLEDGSWLRVRKQATGTTGWIRAAGLPADALDRMDMLKVEGETDPYYGPMQALYFEGGGDGTLTCAGVIPDGLLVQTPEGIARITMLINEVTIDFVSTGTGSTAFLQAHPGDALTLSMLEGAAYVTTGDIIRFVPPGVQLSVPLDENGLPAGAFSVPVSAHINGVQNLYSGLAREPSASGRGMASRTLYIPTPTPSPVSTTAAGESFNPPPAWTSKPGEPAPLPLATAPAVPVVQDDGGGGDDGSGDDGSGHHHGDGCGHHHHHHGDDGCGHHHGDDGSDSD